MIPDFIIESIIKYPTEIIWASLIVGMIGALFCAVRIDWKE